MRRRAGRATKFGDLLLFVAVLGLVLVNIFITMKYFYQDATKRQAASQPNSADSNAEEPVASVKQAESDLPLEPAAQAPEDPDTVPAVYEYSRHTWPYEDIDSFLRKVVSEKHWGPAAARDASTGLYNTSGVEPQKVAAYALHNQLIERTGCDLLTVPFVSASDARCIAYLTDVKHWRVFKPLAMGYDQRTIKFEVDFDPFVAPDGTNVSMLGSILKVSQKLFPNEAFSEVAAYHADRVMHINRIPPTGWVCIPVSMIRQSIATFGSTVETVDEFLEESKAHNYSEWVEKDLFQYAERAHGISTDPVSGQPCIGASIQLRVADVAHLLDSALKIPYIPHNESWFRFLDLAHKHDESDRPLFHKEKFAPSILHISELNTFDFVIGNGDRSPNKNNFVVGGCTRKRDCGNPRHDPFFLYHPGHPTYVHLDQGMGFYGNPRRNPIGESVSHHKKDESSDDTFCLFRTGLINRLVYLHESVEGSGKTAVSRFERLMLHRLPAGVKVFVTPHTLKQCHDRMTKLLHLVERCNALSNHRIRKFVMTP